MSGGVASDQTQLAAAKRGGENAEHWVTLTVDELEPVEGEQHHDAVATGALFPTAQLPFIGVCAVERGAIVEIKSTMVVHTAAQRRGRYKLRRSQHEALLEANAFYVFVVCEPTPERDLLAMKLVPAAEVDELIGPDGVADWRDEGDGRSTKAQIAWTNVFTPAEINGGESV